MAEREPAELPRLSGTNTDLYAGPTAPPSEASTAPSPVSPSSPPTGEHPVPRSMSGTPTAAQVAASQSKAARAFARVLSRNAQVIHEDSVPAGGAEPGARGSESDGGRARGSNPAGPAVNLLHLAEGRVPNPWGEDARTTLGTSASMQRGHGDGVRPSARRERLSVRGKQIEETLKGFRHTPTFAFSGMKLSERVHNALKQFDVDGNDELDMAEVTALMEHVLKEEQQNLWLKWAVLGLVLFTVVLLAGTFGLTWVVIITTKDTRVSNNGVLTSRDGTAILTGNTDIRVTGGLLSERVDPGTDAAKAATISYSVTGNTSDAVNITAPTEQVVRTAQYAGTRLPFTSLISAQSLMELNYLALKGPNSAEVLLRVQGVARIPQWDSYWGTVVVILTPAGTITLDNTDVTFDDAMTPIFSRLNLTSQPTGSGSRRLLQDDPSITQPVQGLFNYVNATTFNMDPNIWSDDGVVDKRTAIAKAQVLQQVDGASLEGDSGSEANMLAAWTQWKRGFVAASINRTQDQARLGNWRDNLRAMASISADPTITYWGAANKMFDKSLDELRSTILADNAALAQTIDLSDAVDGSQAAHSRRLQQSSANLPKRVSWVDQGKVTPIRDQQGCGNCWAMSTIAAIESAYLITQPSVQPASLALSAAQITFCTIGKKGYEQSRGCGGGTPPNAVKWANLVGVAGNTDYPMPAAALSRGANVACRLATVPAALPGVQLTRSYGIAPRNSEAGLMAAVAQNPTIIYFQVWDDFWYLGGGIYNGKCPTDDITVNHAMLVVGYDVTDPNNRYWIVRNSWGTDWAEAGYVRVAMTGDGPGKCGIQLIPVTVVPAFSRLLTDAAASASGDDQQALNTTVSGGKTNGTSGNRAPLANSTAG